MSSTSIGSVTENSICSVGIVPSVGGVGTVVVCGGPTVGGVGSPLVVVFNSVVVVSSVLIVVIVSVVVVVESIGVLSVLVVVVVPILLLVPELKKLSSHKSFGVSAVIFAQSSHT